MLGVRVALLEVEVDWQGLSTAWSRRGMPGVEFFNSGDHAELRTARGAVLGVATWHLCQIHLDANVMHHVLDTAIRGRIGTELRGVWNVNSPPKVQAASDELVTN